MFGYCSQSFLGGLIATKSADGFVSQRLGAHSVRLDIENGDLLIAGNSPQVLLTAEETMALCEFLYQHKGDVFAAAHGSQGDPACEQCHGQGCPQCNDEIYYTGEEALEELRHQRNSDWYHHVPGVEF